MELLLGAPGPLAAQLSSAAPVSRTVLVELFTSEGCSSCPPADDLLTEMVGHRTAAGELIIGLSEHVMYWNGLGWKDPFSSQVFTERQNSFGAHFGLDSVYTPQMVVNGREQLVGSDRHALENAFAIEATRKQLELHILETQEGAKEITFSYSASVPPYDGSFQLFAVLVDDVDHSNVLRGENSGRALQHSAVARALVPLGKLRMVAHQSVTLPLPASFLAGRGAAHHLVLFAQQDGTGAIIGAAMKPL